MLSKISRKMENWNWLSSLKRIELKHHWNSMIQAIEMWALRVSENMSILDTWNPLLEVTLNFFESFHITNMNFVAILIKDDA